MISPELLRQMESAVDCSPGEEVCGLLYRDRYVPLRNLAGKRGEFFADPVGLALCLGRHGEPIAVFHSHPNGNLSISQQDRNHWFYRKSTIIIGALQSGRLRVKAYRLFHKTERRRPTFSH